jgi:transposase
MLEMARRERRSFTKEQKKNAVAAYRACGNFAQVSRELDLHASVLRIWVKQADIDEGNGAAGALTSDERAELTKLRRDLRRVEQERDFLKKAAAYFAKDEDQRTR